MNVLMTPQEWDDFETIALANEEILKNPACLPGDSMWRNNRAIVAAYYSLKCIKEQELRQSDEDKGRVISSGTGSLSASEMPLGVEPPAPPAVGENDYAQNKESVAARSHAEPPAGDVCLFDGLNVSDGWLT